MIATLIVETGPLLVWNGSASSRRGLYLLSPGSPPGRGDMAVAWAPPTARRLAAERHYLPANVPLVKQVAAASGDRVCAIGDRILINGRVAAARRSSDHSGRALPRWVGCKVLRGRQTLLLGTAGPASFDGRYFGISMSSDLIGKARLLWSR